MRSNISTAPAPTSEQDHPARIPAASLQQRDDILALPSTCLVLSLILPIFVIAPLFYPGYIQTHDGLTFLWNVADLKANLANPGWTPAIAARFDPLRGYGLLPYYLIALLPLVPPVALKMVIGLAWSLGSLGIYLWLRSWLGGPGALLAGLVYTYLPHQIATIYVRGAWGEALFWSLLPWAILATTYWITSPRRILLLVAAFFWALLGLTQLGLTIWAFIFIFVLLIVIYRFRGLAPVLAALLGTMAAVVIYLIRLSQPLFVASLTQFDDHFLYPFQLVSATWGTGFSRPGWADGLSFQLGLAGLGLAGLGLYLWQYPQPSQVKTSRTDRRLVFFAAGAVALTLLQFSLASFIWHTPIWPGQSLASTVTYPWQLIGLVGLCLSVLAGAAVWLGPDGQFTRLPIFSAMLIIVVLSVYAYLLPQFIQLDAYPLDKPQAEFGQGQLAILNHNFSVVTSGHTAGLERFETTIPLTLHGPLQAGDILSVNITWQPLQPLAKDFKVFVHLVDSGDNILAQYDGQPQEGSYPTSQWVPGEIIQDAYPIYFPADAPAGPYRVFVGLYDEPTLQRLPVPADPAGRVIFNVQ